MFDKDDLDYVIDWYFTYWVDSIYSAGCEIFEQKFDIEPTCKESAEIFLALFKRLVDEGIILVLPPIKGEPTKKVPNDIANDDFWDVSSDKMIEYIRSVMPKDLRYLDDTFHSKDDIKIETDKNGNTKWYKWYDENRQIQHFSTSSDFVCDKFWYSDCPWIRWVDKNDNNKVY